MSARSIPSNQSDVGAEAAFRYIEEVLRDLRPCVPCREDSILLQLLDTMCLEAGEQLLRLASARARVQMIDRRVEKLGKVRSSSRALQTAVLP